MSAVQWTVAEREAVANVRELTAGLAFGLPPDVEQRVAHGVCDAILTALAPLVAAREAAAWDAGWSARADRPHLRRGEAVPAPSHINPHQGAEDDRD